MAGSFETKSFRATIPTEADTSRNFWTVDRSEFLADPVRLTDNIECEYAIVGAGITGLAAAYLLSQDHRVVVIDRGLIGEGSSGWNAGMLSTTTTIDLLILENLVGKQRAGMLLQALRDTREMFRQQTALAQNDWQTGESLYVAAKSSHDEVLTEESDTRDSYGLETEPYDLANSCWTGFSKAIAFGGEQSVHPLKLLYTLAAGIQRNGSSIFEQTTVDSWCHKDNRFTIECGTRTVTATNLQIGTGLSGLPSEEVPELTQPLMPLTAHILVTQPSEHVLEIVRERGIISLWDTSHLYHYVRYMADGRMLVGGEELAGTVPNKASDPSNGKIQRLYRWAQRHHTFALPPIESCWRGTLAVPVAGLPLVKMERLGDGLLVKVVTDGLPSAMIVAGALFQIADGDSARGEEILKMFSEREQTTEEMLLSWVPKLQPARSLVGALAMAWYRLLDKLT